VTPLKWRLGSGDVTSTHARGGTQFRRTLAQTSLGLNGGRRASAHAGQRSSSRCLSWFPKIRSRSRRSGRAERWEDGRGRVERVDPDRAAARSAAAVGLDGVEARPWEVRGAEGRALASGKVSAATIVVRPWQREHSSTSSRRTPQMSEAQGYRRRKGGGGGASEGAGGRGAGSCSACASPGTTAARAANAGANTPK